MFTDVAVPVGVMVRAPPPTVEMTVRPAGLTAVITWPAVREMERPGAGVVEAPPAAVVGVTEPMTGEPFASVLVVGEGAGGEFVSPARVVEPPATGATGVTRVVAGSAGLPAGVVVGAVPLLRAPT